MHIDITKESQSAQDALVIVEIVRDAHRARIALWIAAERRLQDNRRSMHQRRKSLRALRAAGAATPSTELFEAHHERVILRMKTENRRVRRLIRTYASWQRPAQCDLSPQKR